MGDIDFVLLQSLQTGGVHESEKSTCTSAEASETCIVSGYRASNTPITIEIRLMYFHQNIHL